MIPSLGSFILDLNGKGNPFNKPKGPGLTRERILDLEMRNTMRAIRKVEQRQDNPAAIRDAMSKRERRQARNLALVASGGALALDSSTVQDGE